MFLAAVPTTMSINFKLKELMDDYESISKEKVDQKKVKTLNLLLNLGTLEQDSPDSPKIVMSVISDCLRDCLLFLKG